MATTVIIAVGIMGGLGLIVGVGLAAASKIFYVYVDPLIVEIDEALPGANCGGCGFPGCGANAEAIVAGKSGPDSCVAAGPELAIEIAGILGVSVEAKEPDIALPGCTYGVKDADTKFHYDGVIDCRAAAMLNGGMKTCTIGCLGLGTCMRFCPFDAIQMGENGLPVVDEVLCTGCGTCERVCPKNIITLSSVTRKILHEYTTEDCTTPCQRECPAGIDICEYIRQIGLKNYPRAVQVIKERNPFPTVIGRICPRPCENECRRKYSDEPVAINFLKRFAADYERSVGKRIFPYKAPDSKREVAVVGGGVEGLSTAFFLARLGHRPTVFETSEKLGGLLRTAIAKDRLPGDILDWDIDGILEMGVTAETGKTLGRDFTIDSLLSSEYQSVFLATGGWDSRLTRSQRGKTPIDTTIPKTFLLLDFVKHGLGEKKKITWNDGVVIYGGGSLAGEVAQKIIDEGKRSVTLIFREKQSEIPISAKEIETLKSKGVTLLTQSSITRLVGEKDELTEIAFSDGLSMETKSIACKTLILASGRFPEIIFSRKTSENAEDEETASGEVTEWEGVLPYKMPAFKDEVGVFSKADPITDFSGAIKAIAAGRRAAASIHKNMYGMDAVLSELVLTPQTEVQDVDSVEKVKKSVRVIMPIADHTELYHGSEIEKGFSEEMAQKEADRCLQCGLICYKHSGKMT